jgi:hypothetical protein
MTNYTVVISLTRDGPDGRPVMLGTYSQFLHEPEPREGTHTWQVGQDVVVDDAGEAYLFAIRTEVTRSKVDQPGADRLPAEVYREMAPPDPKHSAYHNPPEET